MFYAVLKPLDGSKAVGRCMMPTRRAILAGAALGVVSPALAQARRTAILPFEPFRLSL